MLKNYITKIVVIIGLLTLAIANFDPAFTAFPYFFVIFTPIIAILSLRTAYKVGRNLGKKWWLVSLPFAFLALFIYTIAIYTIESEPCKSYVVLCGLREVFLILYLLAIAMALVAIGIMSSIAAYVGYRKSKTVQKK